MEKLSEVEGKFNYVGDANGSGCKFEPRPLQYAAANKHDNPKVAEQLLHAGADLNFHVPFGSTPLQLAAYNDNRTIVEFLLQQGADVSIQDLCGNTALHYVFDDIKEDTSDCASSLYENRLLMVKSLFSKGSDVNARNNLLKTPLMMTIRFSHQAIVKELLASGANVNLTNQDGQSCLHMLLEEPEKTNMMVELVKAGAFVDIHDKNGLTPLQSILRREGQEEKNLEEAKIFIKISTLVSNEKIRFIVTQREILKFIDECHAEVARMRSISCGGTADLIDFAQRGTEFAGSDLNKEEIVLETVFQTMMIENFRIYHDWIQAHFQRLYLLIKVMERPLYIKNEPIDAIFPHCLIPDLIQFLSKKGFVQSLKSRI